MRGRKNWHGANAPKGYRANRLTFERVMEPAVIDPDPAVIRGLNDVDIALPEKDVGVLVTLPGMHGLRRNNIMAGDDNHERDVGGLHVLRRQPVKRASL